jgi:hypothetical protein
MSANQRKAVSVFRWVTTAVRLWIGFTIYIDTSSGQGVVQGVFDFSNTGVNGGSRAPVFGPDPTNPSLQQWGNPTNASPPGTQTYLGPSLNGSSFSVQAWYSTNAVSGSTQLLPDARPVSGSLGTNFYAGLFPLPQQYTVIPDALPNPAFDPSYAAVTNKPLYAFLQLRVWDNGGGQYGSWDSAWSAALAGSGRAVGWSRVFWQPITGLMDTTPWPGMPYFESFNAFIVPEPSAAALLLVGFGSAIILRVLRRQVRNPNRHGARHPQNSRAFTVSQTGEGGNRK